MTWWAGCKCDLCCADELLITVAGVQTCDFCLKQTATLYGGVENQSVNGSYVIPLRDDSVWPVCRWRLQGSVDSYKIGEFASYLSSNCTGSEYSREDAYLYAQIYRHADGSISNVGLIFQDANGVCSQAFFRAESLAEGAYELGDAIPNDFLACDDGSGGGGGAFGYDGTVTVELNN